MWAELLLLALLGATGWFWLDSLRARERAMAAARRACERDGLLLLDDTVSCVRLRPGRDDEGHFAFERSFRFEFSDDGDNRRAGTVTVLGAIVEGLQLEPFLLQ